MGYMIHQCLSYTEIKTFQDIRLSEKLDFDSLLTFLIPVLDVTTSYFLITLGAAARI